MNTVGGGESYPLACVAACVQRFSWRHEPGRTKRSNFGDLAQGGGQGQGPEEGGQEETAAADDAPERSTFWEALCAVQREREREREQ